MDKVSGTKIQLEPVHYHLILSQASNASIKQKNLHIVLIDLDITCDTTHQKLQWFYDKLKDYKQSWKACMRETTNLIKLSSG